MNAREAAAVLAEIATLSEVLGENPFRSRAFAGAARALETSGANLAELVREGRLTELRGVGEGIAETLRELVEEGTSSLHRRLRDEAPPGLFEVMRVPGLGTKRVRALYAELGVDSLDRLEAEARAGRVADLSGFGAKTQTKILEGVEFARAQRGRRRYPQAMEAAVALLRWLREVPGVAAAEIAGELRRRMETVDCIVLVAASERPDEVRAAFGAIHGASSPEQDGEDGAAVMLSDGLRVRLCCVPPVRFVAATVWETGSEWHLADLATRAAAEGMCLDGHGLWRGSSPVELPDEEALYRALGLAYVPPELREGLGEVAAASAGSLPRLVELADLRGTFHCHTTASDGKATLPEMAEGARARGWSYLGVADHSRSAGYAGGLTPAAVRKQAKEIDAWNRAHGGSGAGRFRVFKGTESDILPDGRLDFDEDTLALLDYVVGSVHSSFGLPEAEQTTRIIRAVEHPRLSILGHATGRILLGRAGYAVDVRAVIDAAAEHGVAVEINADPHRLDLDWRHVRYAAERGVLVPVNPDAHSVAGLGNVAFGVNVARKGWLEARHVLNTWPLEEVEVHFASRGD